MRFRPARRICVAFQFTRPRGARRSRPRWTTARRWFQFTRPRGARLVTRDKADLILVVSLHAPTGGATIKQGEQVSPLWFQFTRPRGARRRQRLIRRRFSGFNSRAHGGRDGWPSRAGVYPGGFNSRAHGGRDRRPRLTTSRTGRFNSRAHGGRDPPNTPCGCSPARFNSRAHGGRDKRRRTG